MVADTVKPDVEEAKSTVPPRSSILSRIPAKP
jgi:hypothetical protein